MPKISSKILKKIGLSKSSKEKRKSMRNSSDRNTKNRKRSAGTGAIAASSHGTRNVEANSPDRSSVRISAIPDLKDISVLSSHHKSPELSQRPTQILSEQESNLRVHREMAKRFRTYSPGILKYGEKHNRSHNDLYDSPDRSSPKRLLQQQAEEEPSPSKRNRSYTASPSRRCTAPPAEGREPIQERTAVPPQPVNIEIELPSDAASNLCDSRDLEEERNDHSVVALHTPPPQKREPTLTASPHAAKTPLSPTSIDQESELRSVDTDPSQQITSPLSLSTSFRHSQSFVPATTDKNRFMKFMEKRYDDAKDVNDLNLLLRQLSPSQSLHVKALSGQKPQQSTPPITRHSSPLVQRALEMQHSRTSSEEVKIEPPVSPASPRSKHHSSNVTNHKQMQQAASPHTPPRSTCLSAIELSPISSLSISPDIKPDLAEEDNGSYCSDVQSENVSRTKEEKNSGVQKPLLLEKSTCMSQTEMESQKVDQIGAAIQTVGCDTFLPPLFQAISADLPSVLHQRALHLLFDSYTETDSARKKHLCGQVVAYLKCAAEWFDYAPARMELAELVLRQHSHLAVDDEILSAFRGSCGGQGLDDSFDCHFKDSSLSIFTEIQSLVEPILQQEQQNHHEEKNSLQGNSSGFIYERARALSSIVQKRRRQLYTPSRRTTEHRRSLASQSNF